MNPSQPQVPCPGRKQWLFTGFVLAITAAGRLKDDCQECSHCQTVVSQPIAHYLLDCPVLNDIRPQERIGVDCLELE